MKRGFSLIEMIIYVAIMSATMILIVNVCLTLSRSYSSFRNAKDIQSALSVGLETMVKEIREAESIDTAGNELKLNTVYNDASSTVRFYLTSSQLMMDRDDVFQGPLTPNNVLITNLVFHQLNATTSEAVKIDIVLKAGIKEENFYDTVVLRRSYEKIHDKKIKKK
ncbi:MAG: prepilin-type N-terminal cleavage/methylation domain-containing protein [Patescibacteria group bacterium]